MGGIADFINAGMAECGWWGARRQRVGAVTCKRCGRGGLRWSDSSKGWVLISTRGAQHKCDENDIHRIVAAKFDPLD